MRRVPPLCGFAADERGVAAIEMALLVGIVAGALLNVAEVGRYLYSSAAVAAATQAGGQAALAQCPPDRTPATINCEGLSSAVTAAIRGGSLQQRVSLYGALQEGWYCIDQQGSLVSVGSLGNRPGDCSGAGDPASQPVLYLRVRTQFTYQPMFPGVTVVDALPQTLLRSAWMRMD